MPTDTNEALAKRAREKDREAFGELYQRCWPMVHLHVCKWVRDKDEARSIVQETFVRAWEGMWKLREPSAFQGFLNAIATNLVRDAHARKKPVLAESAPRIDPAAADPADAAERSEFDGALLSALADFEPLHQEAIYLRLVEGLKYREVAERLGLRLDQASGIVERGILRLADRLGPFLREDA